MYSKFKLQDSTNTKSPVSKLQIHSKWTKLLTLNFVSWPELVLFLLHIFVFLKNVVAKEIDYVRGKKSA